MSVDVSKNDCMNFSDTKGINVRKIQIICLLVMVTFIAGCAVNLKPVSVEPAELGKNTVVNQYLRALPTPKEKIVAAVYKFRDQTGQYKTSASGASWSTAVTQGATSMLLKSLEDSGWFLTLEREGLSNLLNERKIIRSTRENYNNRNGTPSTALLPPLLYAGITLEGGIIAYETNLVTGGMGAKYFGIGASTQYRKDQITIYLRAVSTQNGRILKTVYTTKSILSQLVDVGVYRYVKFKRLLEVETGYSSNEPPQMCVLEAIEKAVFSLIIEGIDEKLWELKNPQDIHTPLIQDYFNEKQESTRITKIDALGALKRHNNARLVAYKRWGMGGNISVQTYVGDYPNPDLKFAGNFLLKYGLSSRFSFVLCGGGGHIADQQYFQSKNIHIDLRTMFYLLPKQRICPYITAGAGVMNFVTKDKQGVEIFRERKYGGWKPAIISGFGVEYFLNSSFGINMGIENYFNLTDELDGMVHGSKDDYLWNGRFGVIYYY